MNTKHPALNLYDLQQKLEATWHEAYGHFQRIVKARGLRIGAEVGVGFGGHAEHLLAYRGIEKLYGVDSYRHIPGRADPTNLNQAEFNQLRKRVSRRLEHFGDRFELIRAESKIAAQKIDDQSLDFVYIDADHRYESVLGDLGAWYNKVRVGGIIAGHDYGHTDLPGVSQAIDRFFQRLGWNVMVEGDGVWWVIKQQAPVSYIIPAYNAEAYLWQAASSVIDDNLAEGDELIIVNDGSTDATAQVLDELKDKYPALIVIDRLENGGAGAARNAGVEAAQNKLIFMLDADNVLPTDSVAGLRDTLITRGADMVGFSELRLFHCDEQPSKTSRKTVYRPGRVGFADYCASRDLPCAAGNTLFTRESWERAEGYPEHVGALDSWGFVFRQAATGAAIETRPGSFYDHRIGHESYWQRSYRPGQTDRQALSIVRPFFHRFTPETQFYLLHTNNQERWFSRLVSRPLRLEGAPAAGSLLNMTLNVEAIRRRLARLIGQAA
ncbi:MAG: glycosyltransferase [Planctomycetota bacterium]